MARPSERRTIDKVFILLGSATTVVLIIAGILGLYGYSFATNTVRNELASQKVYFPALNSPALKTLPLEDQVQMKKYAGQQLLNGTQAKVYADNFIAVHLKEIANGQTYAQVSSAAMANPSNQQLQQEKNTLFQGETLRALLLGDGYAYWTFAMIAKIAAIASFAGALIMALLVMLGLKHIAKQK